MKQLLEALNTFNTCSKIFLIIFILGYMNEGGHLNLERFDRYMKELAKVR